MANLLPPIPPEKIGENHRWRDWFANLGTYILVAQIGGSPWTVVQGGTGAGTFTAGYLKANGTSAFTTVASIPNTDITGLGTMSTQNAGAVAITGGSVATTTTISDKSATVITPANGGTDTIANNLSTVYLKPGAGVATWTVHFPVTPTDGQMLKIANVSANAITTTTFDATVQGSTAAMFTANSFAIWQYYTTDVKWYRIG